MDAGLLCALLGMTILSHFTFRNSAIGMISKIGINSHYYPRNYISLPKWMRKLFTIKQRVIPRFLYVELLASLVVTLFGLIYVVVICWIRDLNTLGIFILIHACLIIVNTIFLAVMSAIYKKKRR